MMKYSPSKIFRILSFVFVVLYITFATIAFTACSNSETVGADVDGSAVVHCKDIDKNISPTQEDTTTKINSLGTYVSNTEPTNKDSVYPNAAAEISTKNDSTRVDSIITEPTSIYSICSPEVVSNSISEDLPLDDTEYPYAGIPRIVIETENHQAIKDRETEVPAKLQIWGANAPESDIMELTIRGRGNTSWGMPKKSYKIEFTKKQEMLGMPKDKDWALIGNYADKTLMKNYLMYHLSAKLGAYYAPRCEFAELYINNEYLGVYLMTETIKIGKNRVNIPNNDNSYIVEIAENHHQNDLVFYTHVIKTDSIGKPFRIHTPKEPSKESITKLENYIVNFEKFLKNIEPEKENYVSQWMDISECIKHYWIQEFSKNPDADGWSSLYFTWEKDGLIRMGPVWDFDLAFGSHNYESINKTDKWYIKSGYWHSYIFKDSVSNHFRIDYWSKNKLKFTNTITIIDSISNLLQGAAKNNFKKWEILQSTTYTYHRHAYNTYEDAVEDLKNWINERTQWIDKEVSSL